MILGSQTPEISNTLSLHYCDLHALWIGLAGKRYLSEMIYSRVQVGERDYWSDWRGCSPVCSRCRCCSWPAYGPGLRSVVFLCPTGAIGRYLETVYSFHKRSSSGRSGLYMQSYTCNGFITINLQNFFTVCAAVIPFTAVKVIVKCGRYLWSPALAIARAMLQLYFTAVSFSFFFSRHTFSDVRKPTSLKLFHTTWLTIQQNLCYSDFFKVPPKTNGAEKHQICTIFHAKSQTVSAVVR